MNARHFPIVLFALMIAGCGRPEARPQANVDAVSTPASAAPNPREGDSHDLAQKQRSVDIARLPTNTREMLSRLSPRDRELVEGFYRNYGDAVLTFNNKQELLWMTRNGYPLPEDVLEAATLSNPELQARYERGNIKAGFFLLDRKAAAGASDFDTHALANELLTRGGPFSGYAYYRYHGRSPGSEAKSLAGLLWADWQGDYRAANQLMRLTTPATSGSVAFAYQALLDHVRTVNPSLLTRRVDRLLRYKNK